MRTTVQITIDVEVEYSVYGAEPDVGIGSEYAEIDSVSYNGQQLDMNILSAADQQHIYDSCMDSYYDQ